MNNPLVQPDPGLFIWTILTFLVLLFLLAKFAWGPLLQALESRQDGIRKALDDAQQAKGELERLQQESAQIIARARQDADAIITRSRSDAEGLREESAQIIREARIEAESIITKSRADAERLRVEMKEKARAEADGVVRNAERQIQLETTRALQQIRNEAIDLSMMIASKIIQRNLSKEDNERLIDEAVKQIESRRH